MRIFTHILSGRHLMDLDNRLVKGLNKQGITKMTGIQEDCFKPALEGKNIIACSGTGTGKTLAFLLPVIMKNIDNKELYAVVITPSKELCIQICSQINQLSNNSGIPITAAALFSGVNKQRQLQTLKSKPNIVVGTYQRIYELIKEDRKLAAHQVKTLIIDEADKILNKDNIDGITALRKCFMRDIQVMLFSASVTDNTRTLAGQIGADYVNITTGDKITIPTNIEHYYFTVEKRELIETVRKVIKALDTKHCLIFSNSKYDIEEITQKMEFHHYNVKSLHGKLDKNKRRQITDDFRSGKVSYLICSDMAARGLHFDNVDTVINIGLPDKPVDYLHRAGRCGRDGGKAVCASVITENDIPRIKAVQKTFRVNMMPKKLYQGKIVRK